MPIFELQSPDGKTFQVDAPDLQAAYNSLQMHLSSGGTTIAPKGGTATNVPPQTVRMPNGDLVNFPADMPKDQVRSLILSKFPNVAETAKSGPWDNYAPSRSDDGPWNNYARPGRSINFEGITHTFPGDATDAEISSALKNYGLPAGYKLDAPASNYGLPPGYKLDQPSTLRSAVNTFADISRGAGQGATLGWGDELNAAIAAPFEAGASYLGGSKYIDQSKSLKDRLVEAYSHRVNAIRNMDKAAQARSPIAYGTGEALGGLATAGTATKGAAAAATIPQLITRGAGEGAIYGGAYGAGTGEGTEQKIKQGIDGAGIGAVGGAVLGAVGGAVGARAANVPTTADLKAAKTAAYATARKTGGVVAAKDMQQFASDLNTQMTRAGINLGQHPNAYGALKTLVKNSKADSPLENVDLLRRNFLDAAMEGKRSDSRMAGKALEAIDTMMDNYPAGAEWKAARTANKLYEKSSTIDKLMEKAKSKAKNYSVSGMDNAIQTVFRNFAGKDSLMKRFTPEERAAINAVSDDGPTQTVLRKIGKLAPSSGVISNIVTIGSALTGHPYVAAGLVGTEAAKQAARLIRQRRANLASALVRNRGVRPTTQLGSSHRALIGALMPASQE